MKVGILGSGDVAKVLAGGFLKHGHDVTMGTREYAKLAEVIVNATSLASRNSSKSVDSLAAASMHADMAGARVNFNSDV